MKQLICLLLVAITALGLFSACGGKEKTVFKKGVLYTGFGRVDITPTVSTPLGGYDSTDQRMSDVVLDKLYATCIAFTQDKETFLLFTMDAVRSKGDWTNQVRAKLEKELGVPGKNIIIVSTHTHSAPNTNSKHAAMSLYTKVYIDGCVKAAKAAMKDRKESTMYAGSTMTESMTFVRHYIMADGTIAGPNFGNQNQAFKGHVGRNDPEMILYKLERKGGKDILMMNFQAHPTLTGGATVTDVSADYVGVVRQILEDEENVHFAYFLGACGNQTPNSFNGLENNVMPYADQLSSADRTYITYGEALSLYAKDLLPNLEKVSNKGGIKTSSTIVTCNTNPQPVEKMVEAQEVVDVWEAEGREAGNRKAREYGMASVYEASGILGQVNLPASNNVEVYATRIGEMYFVNASYEMFSENALYIKENTPKYTMVMTQSNHAWGYITDAAAYDYKCYENFGGNFAKGSGESLAEAMVSMINEMK